MNVLAIDTATESLGLALDSAGEQVNVCIRMGFRHAELLMPWIERLFHQAEILPQELDLVVVAKGPGSFTGLRIGMATAKGLATGAGCGIVGVASLDSWGLRPFPGTVIPVIDARKKRLYACFYRFGERVGDYLDVSPESLCEKMRSLEEPVLLTGPAASEVYSLVKSKEMPCSPALDPLHGSPNPALLLRRGREIFDREGSHGDNLVPLYLRSSEAESASKAGPQARH